MKTSFKYLLVILFLNTCSSDFDNSFEANSLIVPNFTFSNHLIDCNLKDNCLKIKDTCTNLDSSKEKIKKNILGEIAQRFEDELQLSIDDLKSNEGISDKEIKILDEYDIYLKFMERYFSNKNPQPLKKGKELYKQIFE